MNLLLDTHTFLWFIADRPEMSQAAKRLLEDGENTLHLSVASIWELAIKVSLGKLSIPEPFDDFISQQLAVNEINLLSLSVAQISRIVTLPFHHRDPFDRLLAAQALTDNLPLISRDEIFDLYGVNRLW